MLHSGMRTRDEREIFAELGAVCTSDGYAHALAFLSFRDSFVRYSAELEPEDFEHLRSPTGLIRSEIVTLLGLMVQGSISYAVPSAAALQSYIDRTEALLAELHDVLATPLHAHIESLASGAQSGTSPFGNGPVLREAMFYAPDSAYGFQYRELAARKYKQDSPWLAAHKGFTIEGATEVVHEVCRLQGKKLAAHVAAMRKTHPDDWTLLPGFTFTAAEVVAASGLEFRVVEAVLDAFALPAGDRNESFRTLHDRNAVTATPLLRIDGTGFILYQQYSLLESLYESPFYWMAKNPDYCDVAARNRGAFAEQFCRERLERVFGNEQVYANVGIPESKAKTAGEIDVLVVFGNRALVLQAKSKKLTLESRQGNDRRIRDDFKKSVKDAYGQAVSCARELLAPHPQLVDAESRPVVFPAPLKEVFVLCVVSDHYPSLSFQAREFLKPTSDPVIQPPFVMDVFTLDAITEMLQTPLQFLSYVKRRATYADRVIASHELTVLAYHLKKNLWVDDAVSGIFLDDSVSAELDAAMTVRREGMSGTATPEGVLTRLRGTAVGRLIAQIEADPNPGTLEFGFMLLTLSEAAANDLSSGIDQVRHLTTRDNRLHDLTMGYSEASSGITVHCSEDPPESARRTLGAHCLLRKYAQKARSWHGICLDPRDASIRFGVFIEGEWSANPKMDEAIRDLKPMSNWSPGALSTSTRRIGRNEPCPCGSGFKYKKCHGK